MKHGTERDVWEAPIREDDFERIVELRKPDEDGNRTPWTVDELRYACCLGREKIVRFMLSGTREAGEACPFTDRVYDDAFESGSLEIVKLLHEKGCPFHYYSYAIQNAIYSGNTKLVEYLRAGKEPLLQWSIGSMAAAIDSGDMDMVHCLISLKCPLNARALEMAVERENVEAVRLLLSLGCPKNWSMYRLAAEVGNADIARLLLAGAPPDY